jgi:hypothetical protein
LELAQLGRNFYNSGIGLLLFPLLCCGIGVYIVSRLGGFPPPVWYDLFQLTPKMVQQGQAMEVCIIVAQSLSWLIAWSSLLLMGGIATYSALEKLFMVMGRERALNPYTYGETKLAMVGANPIPPLQEAQEAISQASYVHTQPHAQADLVGPAQPLQLDVRSLRQMGYTPYNASTRPDKRKLDPVLLQQRRLLHRMHLAHVESSKITEPLPNKSPASIEKQETHNDSVGNSYFYWDEFSQIGMGHSPLQKD